LYEAWYGFTEKPFNLTPDPKYLYLSQRHAEAFAHLEFGHRERGGFILITGEVGTGKTTLARYFLSQLSPETHTAVVLYPALTATELLQSILDDLHVEPEGRTLKSLVDTLHRFLLEARTAGRNVVLLIDESQDLSAEVLEQIRLISNLETDTEKLIQIVLMGQSELRDLLARHELRQLAQRITARYHLSPLSLVDTESYIRHRIRVAGGEGKVGFTSNALRTVHRLSEGVPRLINLICDRALLAGYVEGHRTIHAKLAGQAAAEVAGDRPARGLRWRHGLIASAFTVALALLAFALAPRLARAPGTPPSPGEAVARPTAETAGQPVARPSAPAPSAPSPTAAASPAPRSERLDALLRTTPRDESYRAAIARIETLWDGDGFGRTNLRTHLAQLQRLDLPVVLEMFHPSRTDTCFLTLLRLDGPSARVAVADELLASVPVSQVDTLWTREAVFPWPEARELPSDPDERKAWLRGTLDGLGYTGGDLAAVVERFQRDAGLVPDGVPGPRTRLVLFALSSGVRPRLSVTEGES
jgi:general secretion pathway protein A